MNTLYVRCQTKDYILDIVAIRASMRINKVNSIILYLQYKFVYLVAAALPTARGAADICRGEGAHIKHICIKIFIDY